jgi:hypothetical protein
MQILLQLERTPVPYLRDIVVVSLTMYAVGET